VSLVHVIYASLATRAFRGHEMPAIQRLLQLKRETPRRERCLYFGSRVARLDSGRAKTLLSALGARRWQLDANEMYCALRRTV